MLCNVGALQAIKVTNLIVYLIKEPPISLIYFQMETTEVFIMGL